MDYKNMRLDDFVEEFLKLERIVCENGKIVSPYLLNPKYAQKMLVTRGAQDLIYSIKTGSEKGTVINAMVQVLFSCRINDVFRIAQCYLAMVPVVLGPNLEYEDTMSPEKFNSLVFEYYLSLKSKAHEEPFLFENLEETSRNLDAISYEIQRRKHYHFKPSNHNKDQANAIVRNARGEQEFLGVFYRNILMPTIRLPIKK